MKKLDHFACIAVRMLGIVFAGYIFFQGLYTICCIQRITEVTFYMKNGVVRQIIGIALFGCVVWGLQRERVRKLIDRKAKGITWAVLCLVLGVFAGWILITNFWYSGDMEKIYQYAGMILDGDYSGWTPGGYPYEWTQQNGLILFVAATIRVFGVDGSCLVFYFVNLLFYGVILGSMIVILKRLENDRTTQMMQALMVILYFPYGFFITMLYGDVIGLGWGCAAVALLLCYLQDRKVWQIVGSCICMIFAVIFKQNEMILFVGAEIMLLMDCLTPQKESVNLPKEGRGKAFEITYKLMILAAYAILVFAGIRIPDKIIEYRGNLQIEGGNSRWAHIAMGLQDGDKAPGWYNNYVDEVFAESGYDQGKTAEAAKAVVMERLRFFGENPDKAWEFFHKKLASIWNNPTYECFHIQNSRYSGKELPAVVKSVINDGGKLNMILIEILDLAQSIMLFGVLMYLVCVDTKDLRKLFLCILFIGGFLFSVFWEAKCRYVIPFYLLLIPYSYPGYVAVIQKKKIRPVLCVLALTLLIGLSNFKWVNTSLKLNQDTDAYYDYIHEYNHNFEGFRF